MKSILKIHPLVFFILVFSQTAMGQLTSFCGSDTIILNLDNYSLGSIQWQESYDGSTWKPIPNQNKSSYKFFTTEEKYYRAQIITSSCEEIYSRVAYVMQKAFANAGIDQVVYGNKTTLSSNNRDGATGKWKVINGGGGTISDITISSPIFDGTVNTNYSLVWTLSNSCGATSDTVNVSFIQNQYKANYIVVDTTDTILSTAQEMMSGIYHIRFSESVTGINDSIILIGITGEGFLRKTLAFTYEGNNTYLFQTEQGMIDDLCIDGVFNLGDNSTGSSTGKNVSEQLYKLPTREELRSDPRFRDRIFVYQSTPSQNFYNKAVKGEKAGASSDINLTFNNTGIGWTLDNSGSYLFSEQVVLNGTYSFVPNYKFDLLVRNRQLRYLRIDLDNAVLEKNLKTIFSTAITGRIPESDKQFVQKSLYKNSVIRILVIGQVPVVVTTETELLINATVSGSGISSLVLDDKTVKQFSAGMSIEGGVTSTYEDIIQTGIIKAGANITGDMSAETSLTPVIRSKLFGVDGPYVYVFENADALLCGAPSVNNNILWDADLELSMEAEMGSKVTLSKQIIQTISAWFPIGIPQFIYIPEKIEMLAGNNQSGPSGERLPQALRVQVSDNIGYPVPKVEVKFEVTKGNGTVVNPIVITDDQGIAQTYFSIGTSGTENEVKVSAAGCVSGDIYNSPLIFKALSTSSGNSEDCKNSSLAIGFKTNANNTVEPYGILGILPYTYSTDGITFSSTSPQVEFISANGAVFYIRDGKGCEISKPWIPGELCLNSDLNISVAVSGSSATLSGSGGELPYLFTVDSPTGFSSLAVYNNLADGSHTAYIMDSQLCTRSVGFIIGGLPGGGGGGGLPVISVPAVSGQTETSATVSGTITVPGTTTTGETGFCWSVTPNPTLSNSHSSVGSGAGSYSLEITGLDTATIYYIRIYTITSDGVVYGNEVNFSTKIHPIRFNPNLTYGSLTDVEGNVYKTIQIGNQIWMAENLRTTKYNNGTSIYYPGTDNLAWQNNTTGAMAWYNNDSTAFKHIFGALYNWYAVSSGYLCPTGWHIPGDGDWFTLSSSLGGDSIAGGKLKENGRIHWIDPNMGASNESGFTALPGGFRYPGGEYEYLGQNGLWWSSTENLSTHSWGRDLVFNSGRLFRYSELKHDGFSVRCVKDSIKSLNGLVAWYPFNSNTNDESGNGNDGQPTPGCQWGIDRFGNQGKSLFLNGHNLVYIPPSASLDLHESLTLSVWFKSDSIEKFNQLIYRGDPTPIADPYWIRTQDNLIRFERDYMPLNSPTVEYPLTGLDKTKFHFFAATYEHSSGKMKIYIDGNLVKEESHPAVFNYSTSQMFNVIGGVDNIPACIGYIDDVRIYSRALSLAGIDSLYHDGGYQGDLPKVTDIDGNTYNTVQIGNQIWMAENLRTTMYNDGTSIPLLTGNPEWIAQQPSGYCWYNNDSSAYASVYGGLYSYFTANSGRLCPAGWRLPTDTEWSALADYLGGVQVAGGKLKQAGNLYWNSPNISATNESGFSALPGGIRIMNGLYSDSQTKGYWWSSTDNYPLAGTFWGRSLSTNSGAISKEFFNYNSGLSVRCIRNQYAVITTPILETYNYDLSSTYISVRGKVISDEGSSVIAQGICWSTSQNPTLTDNKTIVGPGPVDFVSRISGLTPNTVYYFRAYATNSIGTGYGNQLMVATHEGPGNGIIFNTNLNYGSISDIDGNNYKTIQIGTQTWMAENLKVTKYNDGTVLFPWTDTATVGINYYHNFNNNSSYTPTYGYLYNGYVLSNGKNICPTSWHVSTESDWTMLETFAGGTSSAGEKLKETGTVHWNTPNIGADNSSGFTALGGGCYTNTFTGLQSLSRWWIATPYTFRTMFFNRSDIESGTGDQEYGCYIRCVKDNK